MITPKDGDQYPNQIARQGAAHRSKTEIAAAITRRSDMADTVDHCIIRLDLLLGPIRVLQSIMDDLDRRAERISREGLDLASRLRRG